jgi:hypothetical protein
MLSSVPITIGGVEYLLQFTGGDMFTLEGELRKIGIPPFSVSFPNAEFRQSLDMQATMLYVGLKIPGKPDARGNPVRVCQQGPAGLEMAQDLLRQFSKGRLPPMMVIEFDQVIWDALSAAEWYNLNEIKNEAAASVLQKVEPPKNSEGTGSSP